MIWKRLSSTVKFKLYKVGRMIFIIRPEFATVRVAHSLHQIPGLIFC